MRFFQPAKNSGLIQFEKRPFLLLPPRPELRSIQYRHVDTGPEDAGPARHNVPSAISEAEEGRWRLDSRESARYFLVDGFHGGVMRILSPFQHHWPEIGAVRHSAEVERSRRWA